MTPKDALERAMRAQAKPGTWARDFAFKRRTIDRVILAEAENYFTDLEAREATEKPQDAPIDFSGVPDQEARAAIARAFGRPLR